MIRDSLLESVYIDRVVYYIIDHYSMTINCCFNCFYIYTMSAISFNTKILFNFCFIEQMTNRYIFTTYTLITYYWSLTILNDRWWFTCCMNWNGDWIPDHKSPNPGERRTAGNGRDATENTRKLEAVFRSGSCQIFFSLDSNNFPCFPAGSGDRNDPPEK